MRPPGRLPVPVYIIVLDSTLPSPLSPQSDEEKAAEEDKKAGEGAKDPSSGSGAGKEGKTKPSVTVKVDLDGIEQRVLSVPMPTRRYVGLQVGKPGVLLALEMPVSIPPPAPGDGFGPALTVQRYDMTERKTDAPLTGVSVFQMSYGGEKALYKQGENWIIAALRSIPVGPGVGAPVIPPVPPAGGAASGILKTDAVEVRVDPAQEWKQMYREAWRIERDWFYDRNVHGYDLKAAERKYEPYLRNVAARSDLTYLFQEILGEMTVSHLGTGGGDAPEVKRVQTGLLGADYEIADGRYRFARVYNGENWNPQLRAPLTQPGVNVRAG
jgi:tricorn protease